MPAALYRPHWPRNLGATSLAGAYVAHNMACHEIQISFVTHHESFSTVPPKQALQAGVASSTRVAWAVAMGSDGALIGDAWREVGDVVSSSASSVAPIGVSMILGGSDCSGLAQCTRFPPSAAPERSGGDPLFNPPNRVALCQARSAARALGAKVLSRVGVPGFLAPGYSVGRARAEHAPPLRTALRRREGLALRQSINPPSQGQQACTNFSTLYQGFFPSTLLFWPPHAAARRPP